MALTQFINRPKAEEFTAEKPAEKTREKPKSFFMVQGSQGRPAKVKHPTFEIAHTEAKRLAQLNPGKKYWVMKSVCTVIVKPGEISDATEKEVTAK